MSIHFSQKHWILRQAQEKQGPGPNYFSSSSECVYLNENGHLIMRIAMVHGRWTCSEVILNEQLGYGSYIFHVGRGHDDLEPRAVLGLFTYQDEASNWDPNPNKQIDVEIARWSDPNAQNTQYVSQPAKQGNFYRFTPAIGTGKAIVHAFTWRPDHILFQSYFTNNLYQVVDIVGRQQWHHTQIKQWKYTGNYIPKPENQKVHINFWLHDGQSPMYNHNQTIQILAFRFKP